MITRRSFLQRSGLATGALLIPRLPAFAQAAAPKALTLDPNTLAKFVDPLPIPPIAQPLRQEASPDDPKIKLPYYRVAMKSIEARIHRDLKPATMWGYGGSVPGPSFETRSGGGVLVEWANELPAQHLLKIDHHVHGAERDKAEVRTVVHLHGGRTPPESDGYPENWLVPEKSAVFHYPNQQDAAMLWYHDHALGINRLNVYAGLCGVFFVRDSVEEALNLPSGRFEIPLVIFDRLLTPEGQLYYPVSDKADAPWMPEVFGNAILVNGKLFPFLEVEARKYRFRLLNAANGRFFHLSLSNGAAFHQIGTDQGLLPAPIDLKQVTLAPGERTDLIVDFSLHAGEQIELRNDVFRPVMQLRVGRAKGTDDSTLPATLRPLGRIPETQAVRTRELMLAELNDLRGDSVNMLLDNKPWHAPISEKPALNSVEIWKLTNVTDDAHPIHLHLVRFQILDRQRFDVFAYQNHGVLRAFGKPEPPEPGENGWKDTVRANPGMITRIIVPFTGYTGRYVWHCHILEHEDNEMMRPYEVVAG